MSSNDIQNNNPNQINQSAIIDESIEVYSNDEFKPIQSNSTLFKFILYTSKVEIKSNNFMRMVYTISLLELMLWFVGLLLFVSAPTSYYHIWFLLLYPARGVLGLILLNSFPKTYEVLENLSKNPNYEEDKLTEMVHEQLKETFTDRFADNRVKLIVYFSFTIASFIIDIILFWIFVFIFGNEELALMELSLLFITVFLLGK